MTEATLRSRLERVGECITYAEQAYVNMRDMLRRLDTAFELLCEELKETRAPFGEPPDA